MAIAPSPNLFQSHSLAGTQPQKGPTSTRFSPALEAEYVHSHLMHSRALIRTMCALALLLAAMRCVELFLSDSWHSPVPFSEPLIFAGTAGMLGLTWGRAFERWYLPYAQVFVPIRNALSTTLVVYNSVQGMGGEFMVLPLMVVGPFFFLGFQFRAAAIAAAAGLLSFVVSGIYFGLPLAALVRSSTFLTVTAVACATAALLYEKRLRAGFLQSRVVAEFAERDALTALRNRRVFDDYLSRLWLQATRDGRSIAILLVDVDYFKTYNDRYGHQAGDVTLRRVAQTLQRFTRRPLDILARYGGEEFAAIHYDIDARSAEEIANGMRRAVEGLSIEHRGSRIHSVVTISVGVAVVRPTPERKPLGALQLADEALYEAKARGRNRVEIKDDAEYKMLVTGVFSKVTL